MNLYKKSFFAIICLTLGLVWLWCSDTSIWTVKNAMGRVASNRIAQMSYSASKTIALDRIPVKYFDLETHNMILYSAVATNSTPNTTWDIVAVQGWLIQKKEMEFRCCALYSSGENLRSYSVKIQTWTSFSRVKYGALQIQCHFKHQDNGVPMKVTIEEAGGELNNVTCSKDPNMYLTIGFAYKRSAIAVFMKVLFAQLNFLDLLAWFEIHRSLGVDRVLGYVTDDLNEKSRVVLGHYQRIGFFEALHYTIPFKGQAEAMQKATLQSFSYRGVTLLDGQIRLGGYDYLICIDADEYILPAKTNQSLRPSLDHLFSKQNAAGFIFKSYFFVKNWGGDPHSNYSAEKYLLRSEASNNRQKHVVIPKRGVLGSIRTHSFEPLANYKRYYADEDDIAVHHFRGCSPKIKVSETKLCNRAYSVRDDRVFNIFKLVEKSIERIRNLYGL